MTEAYPLDLIKQYIDKSVELAKHAKARTGEQILLIHQAAAMMEFNKLLKETADD